MIKLFFIFLILTFLAFLCGSTILLEGIPILFLKNKKAWWKASLLCNVVTNPILNVIVLLLPVLLHEENWFACVVILLEVAVVFLEAWFYRLMLGNTYRNCFLFSLIANGISFIVGSTLNLLITH